MTVRHRVIAVVVTYNRIHTLKRCIHKLRDQTREPDEIIVIDNGSNDGTEEWLLDQPDVRAVRQDNLGSAGGQKRGMEIALEMNASHVWCMDDDGYPAPDALKHLIDSTRKIDDTAMLNCLVLDSDDASKLAFPLTVSGETCRRVSDLPKDRRFLVGGNPFNGTLVPATILQDVGLVNPVFFIKGDEKDFKLRVARKYRFYTDLQSQFYHPSPQFRQVSFLGQQVSGYGNDLNAYFYTRNALWLLKLHGSQGASLTRTIGRAAAHVAVSETPPDSLAVVARALWNGIKEDPASASTGSCPD